MLSTQKSNIKIILVGGGTGGHFYPLISMAEALNQKMVVPMVYYAGPNKFDAEALTKNNISFLWIPAGKQRRYFSFLNFIDPLKTLFGCFWGTIRLFIIYPDVIFSKGGYTSVPVTLAAAFLRIPIIVHESDSVFGTANKLSSRFAEYIITAYDEAQLPTKSNDKILKLGIPIRSTLLQKPSQTAIEDLNIDQNKPVLLILGGSQGAERVNDAVFASLDDLLNDFTIIHQTGTQNFELAKLTAEKLIQEPEKLKSYHPFPFLDAQALNNAYHLSSLVISRAGSNSIYEIALHGKPSILIPIPISISHDQRSNAFAYARYGATSVIEEENLSEGILLGEIGRIVQNPTIYETMVTGAESFAKADAASRILELIDTITSTHNA